MGKTGEVMPALLPLANLVATRKGPSKAAMRCSREMKQLIAMFSESR